MMFRRKTEGVTEGFGKELFELGGQQFVICRFGANAAEFIPITARRSDAGSRPTKADPGEPATRSSEDCRWRNRR
jgi:hypothetical protein